MSLYIRGYTLFVWKHLYNEIESNLKTFMCTCVHQVPVMQENDKTTLHTTQALKFFSQTQ